MADLLPTAQGPSNVTVTEGVAYSFTGSNRISLHDADGGGPATVEVTLSVAHGTLTLGSLTGLTFTTGDGSGDASMVFTASQTDADSALATLSYTATGNTDTSDSLNIQINGVAVARDINLRSLASGDGFRIAGVGIQDNFGNSVSSAGDINGDGIDDLIVGAVYADPNSLSDAGAAYVVYGRSGGYGSIDLAALASSDGFRIAGASGGDKTGWSVSSAGDVNGDGVDDMIVGARYADPNSRSDAGTAYVIYGRSGGYSGVGLATLASSDGFKIAGVSAYDNAGYSVSSAGDINGDGIDDLIVGAYYADPSSRSDAGAAYVVYGRSGGYSGIDLAALASSDGFRIAGADENDNTGWSASSAGDVNGDGIEDLIVGAISADPSGRNYVGAAYVIYGRSSGYSGIDLATLASSDGFTIVGVSGGDFTGWSVSSAGDVNHDGIDDLMVGANRADPNDRDGAGAAYVFYGRSGGYSSVDLADLASSDGFRIAGANGSDRAGYSVSSAGDVNGDGIDDLIVGAAYADANGETNAGAAYVIYGKSGGYSDIDLADLASSDGFRIAGATEYDTAGVSVSAAGDINRDGVDDLIVGASRADPSDRENAGASYVIYGVKAATPTDGSITINISGVNDAPGFTGLDGNAAFTEGGTAVVLDANVTVADAELDLAGNYNGAVLTISRSGGTAVADDRFSFASSSDFTVSGSSLMAGGQTIASFSSGGGTLTVTFTTHATPALVDTVMQHVAYSNASATPPGSVTLAWALSDGNTGAQGSGGALSATGSSVVTITAVDGLPTAQGPSSVTATEGVAYSFTGSNLISLNDADGGGPASVKVTLSVAHGTLTLGTLTGLTFVTGDGSGDANMVFTASQTAANSALATLSYTATGSTDTSDSLNIQVAAPRAIDLASLASSDGFAIAGAASYDSAGYSVSSAGDINGDGIDDLIVGAIYADPSGREDVGAAYVVYGRSGGYSGVDLAALVSSDGFTIAGIAQYDSVGYSVSSAGDVNGDGIDDLIVGAKFANPNGRDDAGAAYVVYGRSSGHSGIDLAAMASSDGFTIAGSSRLDDAGWSVSSAGDVNGDGIDDLIVGAIYADVSGREDAGAAYVVYGRTGGYSGVDLSTLASSDGFRIAGVTDYDYTGSAVSSAGDVNGDGIDDLIVGAYSADPNDRGNAGAAYVVYGRSGGYSGVDLNNLASSDGFTIAGANVDDRTGISVSDAGDINGDGIDDLIVGAQAADPSGRTSAGAAYVIYGRSSGYGNVDLAALASSDGFNIAGASSVDNAGISVSSAGDVNGDGIDDLIVWAHAADPSGRTNAGAAYLIYGKSGGYSGIDLSNLASSDGFIIAGASNNDRAGTSVSAAGDINGDGVDDLIVGARYADPSGRTNAGASYVIYGVRAAIPTDSSISITIADLAAPSNLALADASNSGSTSDAVTNDTTPTIQGMATAGATVKLYKGSTLLGTGTAGSDGAWSITPTSTLNDGDHDLTATATVGSNTTGNSTALSVTIDTTAPSAPVISAIAATNDTTPVISGTAEAGSTVNVSIGGATYRTIATGGSWSIDLGTATPASGTLSINTNGSNAITATATDIAGNISAAGTQSVTIDATAPAAPVISSIATTNDTTPVISGTAEAGSTVTVSIGGATYRTIATGGNWSLDLGTASPVSGTLAVNANGSNSITATATDALGNISSAGTQSVTIDTTAPSAPVISSIAATSDTTPVISGTAEAGSTVTVSIGGATYRTVASGGTWSVDLGTATPVSGTLAVNTNGSNAITATATDMAGNISAAGTQSVTIDATAPAAPVINAVATANDTTPVISGTAEAGSTVTVSIGGATYSTIATGGTWSVDLGAATPVSGTLAVNTNGSNAITATATDMAGNVSAVGTQSVTIDVRPPLISDLNITQARMDGGLLFGFDISADEAGATYTWTFTGSGGGSLSGSGSMTGTSQSLSSLSLDSLTGSALTLTVVLTDSYGNSGVARTVTLTRAGDAVIIPVPPKTAQTVDGAGVTYTQNAGGTGGTTTIMAPPPDRVDDNSTGNAALADVPVVQEQHTNPATGQVEIINTLTVSLSANISAAISGTDRRTDVSQSLTDMIREINQRTDAGSGSQEGLSVGSTSYLSTLPTDSQLVVRSIDFTSQGQDDVVVQVTGADMGTALPVVLVLNTTGVSGQTIIDLNDVQFAAIIGDATIVGGAGQQTVYGDANSQVMILGEGDDELHGGDGDDTVASTLGQDTLFGDAGNDVVHGGDGNDWVLGGTGDDVVGGGTGDDRGFGGDGNDILFGEDGNDTLAGGSGADTLDGGAGDDILFGEEGNDLIIAGTGDDMVAAGDGADTVLGGAGDDLLGLGNGDDLGFGEDGNDILFGEDGNDTLSGGAGNDTLNGGAGDDTLFADGGSDMLWGGEGRDVFAFGAQSGGTVIADFTAGVDQLALYDKALDLATLLATAKVVNGNTIFDLGGHGTITIIGQTDVSAAWFTGAM